MIDLICGIVPILVPYLVYGIPVNITEFILIWLVPSISVVGKVRTLFKEALYNNLNALLVKKEEKESIIDFGRFQTEKETKEEIIGSD